jgi:hypothetical protein
MWNIWPFGRKTDQRSMTIDEFMAMAGIQIPDQVNMCLPVLRNLCRR